jgi:hypothetical protein
MLSDELPAIGALIGEQRDEADVERRPWHFESDDTLVIPPEPGLEPGPQPDPFREPAPEPETVSLHEPYDEEEREPDDEREYEPVGVASHAGAATTAASAAAASRLSPPRPPEPKPPRAARTSRSAGAPRTGNVNTAGTGGRDMRVAIGTGVLFGAVALICFAAGTVATLVLVTVLVVLATAEGYAAFRSAHHSPATLLGLIAVLSLMIETYNKGVAALPLILVLLVAGSFVWFLARVEAAADPVSGLL